MRCSCCARTHKLRGKQLYVKKDPPQGPDTAALLGNGLNFLNRAREELEAGQFMFFIVSFWTAIEILLKVPLVHEH